MVSSENLTIKITMKKTSAILSRNIQIYVDLVLVPDEPIQACGFKYDRVDQCILNAEGLSHNPGHRHVAVWSPDREISSKDAEMCMKSITTSIEGKTLKGRPSTVQEFACCHEVPFHERFQGRTLVALGEKLRVGSETRSVVSRCISESDRRLDLTPFEGDWDPQYCFLVTLEEVPSEE